MPQQKFPLSPDWAKLDRICASNSATPPSPAGASNFALALHGQTYAEFTVPDAVPPPQCRACACLILSTQFSNIYSMPLSRHGSSPPSARRLSYTCFRRQTSEHAALLQVAAKNSARPGGSYRIDRMSPASAHFEISQFFLGHEVGIMQNTGSHNDAMERAVRL